jgi:hypothetical protein
MSYFEQLLTGKDNQTHDIARWSWALSFILLAIVALWQVIHSNAISLRELAESIGLISGAHSAAIWAKKDTEPVEVK